MEEYGCEEDPPEAEMHYGKKLRNEIKYTGEYIGEKRNSLTLYFFAHFYKS